MGMTVHYIRADVHVSEDISRASAALACRRFTVSHTHERIAEMICDIHAEFNISVDKISATVTDNASNFGKAFHVYMAPGDGQLKEHDDVDDEVDITSVDELFQQVHEIRVPGGHRFMPFA